MKNLFNRSHRKLSSSLIQFSFPVSDEQVADKFDGKIENESSENRVTRKLDKVYRKYYLSKPGVTSFDKPKFNDFKAKEDLAFQRALGLDNSPSALAHESVQYRKNYENFKEECEKRGQDVKASEVFFKKEWDSKVMLFTKEKMYENISIREKIYGKRKYAKIHGGPLKNEEIEKWQNYQDHELIKKYADKEHRISTEPVNKFEKTKRLLSLAKFRKNISEYHERAANSALQNYTSVEVNDDGSRETTISYSVKKAKETIAKNKDRKREISVKRMKGLTNLLTSYENKANKSPQEIAIMERISRNIDAEPSKLICEEAQFSEFEAKLKNYEKANITDISARMASDKNGKLTAVKVETDKNIDWEGISFFKPSTWGKMFDWGDATVVHEKENGVFDRSLDFMKEVGGKIKSLVFNDKDGNKEYDINKDANKLDAVIKKDFDNTLNEIEMLADINDGSELTFADAYGNSTPLFSDGKSKNVVRVNWEDMSEDQFAELLDKNPSGKNPELEKLLDTILYPESTLVALETQANTIQNKRIENNLGEIEVDKYYV